MSAVRANHLFVVWIY